MLEIINPLTGEIIEVASSDLEYNLDWNQAVMACSELSGGWRLPSKEEFEIIYDNLYKQGIGNFNLSIYWTSEEISDYAAWNFHFESRKSYGFFKSENYFVRAVRISNRKKME